MSNTTLRILSAAVLMIIIAAAFVLGKITTLLLFVYVLVVVAVVVKPLFVVNGEVGLDERNVVVTEEAVVDIYV